MNLINLLSSTFTFDGVHFYKNHFSFTLFGHEFTIAFYAIAIVLGMIVCVILARPLCKKAGLNPDILLDYMIAIIPISIICARLWYVLTDLKSFHSFYDVIAIWNGGNAIFGGVMGGALAIFIVSKIKKIPFFTIADMGGIMLPLGQAIGRWGNFFNQEVYGGVTTAHFPFGVYIAADGEWHVALFFIEGLLNLALFAALYTYYMKRKNVNCLGYTTGMYLFGYGTIRAILEPLRDAQFNLTGWGFKTQVLTGIVSAVIGAAIVVYCLWRDKKWFFKYLNKKSSGDFFSSATVSDNGADIKEDNNETK